MTSTILHMFKLNSENLVRFYFSLSSKLNHVNIGKPDITGKTNVKLSVSDLSFCFSNPTDEEMIEQRFQSGRVIPPHLVGTLKLEQDTAQRKQHYYVSEIKFGPCPIKWSLGIFWKLIWMRSIAARMDFNIHLLIPPNQLALAESFRSKYFTNNLNCIDRIYSPQDLIEYLSKEPIHINIPVKCK